MSRRERAAQELNCQSDDLDTFGPNRGTMYHDGESDWTETFVDRLTGNIVTVYEYAHDDKLRVGFVTRTTGNTDDDL